MDHDFDRRTTAEHMADPRPGDRFSEMCSYWVKVVARCGQFVVSRDGWPEWKPPRLDMLDEFRARFAYGTIPGYWVRYYDDKGSVADVPSDPAGFAAWLAVLAAERETRVAAPSMNSACL